jgi:hypothetical protein
MRVLSAGPNELAATRLMLQVFPHPTARNNEVKIAFHKPLARSYITYLQKPHTMWAVLGEVDQSRLMALSSFQHFFFTLQNVTWNFSI